MSHDRQSETAEWPLSLLAALTAGQINDYCEQGRRAGRDGHGADACPYDAETAEALCWLDGWCKS